MPTRLPFGPAVVMLALTAGAVTARAQGAPAKSGETQAATHAPAHLKFGPGPVARANGATEIQVASTGPFVVNYVNPADDPRTKKTGKPKSR